jgi:8-oxo-dGTP pyrophosphatase MutT (NUDIX family)
LEIPGGSTHGRGEEPRLAGERELLEETGYQAREWFHCGHHFPNPALQDNRMHTFLAVGCQKVQEPCLDPYEDLIVKIQPVRAVVERLLRGEIKHSLIAASLTLTLNELKKRFPDQF